MHLHHFRTLALQRLRRRLLRFTLRTLSHLADDPVRGQLVLAAHTLHHVPHALHRMLGQQLQHPNVLPHPFPRAVTPFQTPP